jgi:hypothetical protein
VKAVLARDDLSFDVIGAAKFNWLARVRELEI